jgi:hypothetical protein
MRLKNPVDNMLAKHVIRLAQERPEWRKELRGALRAIVAKERGEDLRARLVGMLNIGGSFGVLSAGLGKDQAKDTTRLAQLKQELSALGYRKFTPIKKGTGPNSLVVPNIRATDLLHLGKRFNQEYVIFRTRDGVIGAYHLKGDPKAYIGINPIGDSAFNVSTDPSLNRRTKALSFHKGILWAPEYPWDGADMINRKKFQIHIQNLLFNLEKAPKTLSSK